MKLSKRINSVADSVTMKSAQRAIELKNSGINLIDLTVGEPDFPTPENIKNAAKEALDRNQTKYTVNSGLIELRKAICQRLKYDHNLDYSPDEIIVSTGAKQSIFNAIQVLINDGDEVLLPVPGYVSYEQIVNFAGGKPVKILCKEDDNFLLKPEQLKKNITSKTKMLVLCNPSNPTGAVHFEKDLVEIINVLQDKDIFILVDEIYEKLIYDNQVLKSFPSLSEKIKEKTILINGFSKSYAMTGWRLGYAAADRKIISAMNKLQSHSTSNASTISQVAGIEAMLGPQDFILEMQNEYQLRRDFLITEFERILERKIHKPAGAFYIFLNIQNFLNEKFNLKNSIDFSNYLLEKHGIATVPSIGFGVDGFIRISYTKDLKTLKAAINKFEQAFKELSV